MQSCPLPYNVLGHCYRKSMLAMKHLDREGATANAHAVTLARFPPPPFKHHLANTLLPHQVATSSPSKPPASKGISPTDILDYNLHTSRCDLG